MAKGKLILICQAGGEFVTNDDGTMSYNGGEANATNVTSETPFNVLKLNLAETCDLNQDTMTVKYFLPGNKRNLITVKNDKDVKRMIDFHGDAITAEVFLMGTPGFNRSALETQTNRQKATENDETANDDNLRTKKDEKKTQGKAGPVKDKKRKKEDKIAESTVASPARTTCRSITAAKKEKEKTDSDDSSNPKGSTSDTSSSSESKQVNVNVDSDYSSDYVLSQYVKRKKVNRQNETEVNASPADIVKKRRRTPSWKLGADGRPTIVSSSFGSNSKSKGSSGNMKPQRKSGELVSKEDKKRKRGRPQAVTSDQEPEDLECPFVLNMCDDDVAPETLVSLWKSAIRGAGQHFPNVHELQETLKRYAIANGFEFKLTKTNRNCLVGECAFEGCSWKLNAVRVSSSESINIKTMNNAHTCDKDRESNNRLLSTITEKLQDSPHLKPKEIAVSLLKDFGADSNRRHVFDATMISREPVHGSDKDVYNTLPWFCDKIMETNPGSVSKLVIGENKRFKALFVSFYASLCGFNSCRPLLFLEATPMWSKYGEVLFTANAIDGNDVVFPVAFAVVDVEDDGSWRWFLGELKTAIFNSQHPITFVFDHEKNLKTSILDVFPDSYIGYSIYHLLESFKKNTKGPFHRDGKSSLPFYILTAAHAVRLAGFKKSTEQLKQISSQAYDWIMQTEPQHWSSSSFKGERFNHVIDDVCGPVSKLMEDYRELPVLHKINVIILTMIDAINDAKLDGSMWSTHLTPSKEKQLQEESVQSSGLKVLISSDSLYEVREDSTHVVNTSDWSCTCLGWKETGLPCRHALAVFTSTGKNPYEFCSSYFTVDAYRLTYQESINPVPIEREEGEKTEGEKVGGEKEQTLKVESENVKTNANTNDGEKMESEKVGGEKEQSLKVEGENVNTNGGEKIEDEEERGEKVEVEEEKGEKMEVEVAGGESEEGGKLEGEKVETEEEKGEKMEVEDAGGESEEGGKLEGEKVEVEVEEEKGGEKMEIKEVAAGGESEEGGKLEGENGEVEKDEGVVVLPPIPGKAIAVMEKEWDEREMERKRTVTCTKCKQPGHNRKSCNLYHLREAC